MVPRRSSALVATVLLAGVVVAAIPSTGGAAQQPERAGFRALRGADAAAFVVPADVVTVWQARLPDGGTQTRYQQRVGDAEVLGGQLTVLRDRAGVTTAVIGAHHPGLSPTVGAQITADAARRVAEARIGSGGTWLTKLMIDPVDARLFWHVENRRFDARWIHWVDAATGEIRNAFDAIAYDGPGIGVKGDVKTVDSSVRGATNVLVASDGRQETFDGRNRNGAANLPGSLFTDIDDTWDLAGRTSPGLPAAVDAHYYAGVVDDFYVSVFGRDSFDDEGATLVSTVHWRRNYNNAFWSGAQVVYGDGDGSHYRELSGGLDVVGHEITHGVTQFTSNLIYQDESGALNEAFSDMMGNTIEFFADEATTSNCTLALGQAGCADWWIGEDVDVRLPADTVPGFRSMADPQEDQDPDHYSELLVTHDDNGGVHTNSGIPNHAYYLLANGGRNAGCDSIGSNGHVHTADCDVTVTGVGVDDAAAIFYQGFTSLNENANMCNARLGTLAIASGYEAGVHLGSVAEAWQAVGVGADCDGEPPPPSCDVPNAVIPFESSHPYQSNLDCRWTYDNGTAGFRLHFSLLDTEAGFDFVFVTDGVGTTLHELSGRFLGGFTTDCITTQTVEVRLITDPLINRRGFTVDAALAC